MQSQQDEEVRSGIALYNSDTDDWTLVSPPPSEGSISPEASPERRLSDNENKPTTARQTLTPIEIEPTASLNFFSFHPHLNTKSNPPQSCSRVEPISKRRTSPLFVCARKLALASESSSLQKMVLTGATRSERANDADDESDGMTEVNLDGMASIKEQTTADAPNSDNESLDEWTDDGNEDKNQDGDFRSKRASRSILQSSFESFFEFSDKATAKSWKETMLNIEIQLKKHRRGHRVERSGLAAEFVAPHGAVADQSTSKGNSARSARQVAVQAAPRVSSDQSVRQAAKQNTSRKNPGQSAKQAARRLIDQLDRLEPFFLSFIFTGSLLFLISCTLAPRDSTFTSQRAPRRLFNNTFDFLYSDPTNHAYTELKMLNEEIADCIERENPVMRELAHWRSMNSKELSKYKTITNTRPFKGLVCYESEVKWRNRFNFLKTEFNFDLRKITRQIKRRLTNDILVNYHPNTPFELILNQLEYLDHIEQRRKDRSLEKMKAENLELLRRLNERSSSQQEKRYNNKSQYNKHQQQEKNGKAQDQSSIKSLIILESENIRLRREVETLKSRLGEKAGTIYIKQSLELEKCERENNALKQFHQDVADEINSNLNRVGSQQAADFSTHMTTNSNDNDEDNSLSARLDSTRHSLARLGDDVAKLVERNKFLEKELAEAKMLNALAIREAQKNLIEDANQTKHSSDKQQGRASLFECKNNDHKPVFRYDSARGVEEIREEHLTDRLEESNRDWLSKRAQLREQLRDSSSEPERHLSDLRRVLRSVPQPLQSNHKHNCGRPKHVYESNHHHNSYHHDRHFQSARDALKEAHNSFKGAHDSIKRANNDISNERKRLDSLKRLNKRLNRFGSSTVNSYNENSHKNCKNHHKRDEL